MTTIFVSTGTSDRTFLETTSHLIEIGVRHIEASGGDHSEHWKEDLDALTKDGAELAFHNYFPPPREEFVLNLGSADEEERQNSIGLATSAIQYSKLFGSTLYGVHSPYSVEISAEELGQKISHKQDFGVEETKERFLDSMETLLVVARDAGVQLYVENSPLTSTNLVSLGRHGLLGVTADEVIDLAEAAGVRVLADLGHLKVSCATLGLDLVSEARKLLYCSDYLHLHENAGTADDHLSFESDCWFLPLMREKREQFQRITLEVSLKNADELDATIKSVERALA